MSFWFWNVIEDEIFLYCIEKITQEGCKQEKIEEAEKDVSQNPEIDEWKHTHTQKEKE